VAVQVGGSFNLAAVAKTMDDAASGNPLVIVADGDGQALKVQRQIETGLDASGLVASSDIKIIVFEPTFEEVLGVFERLAGGRRRPLERDRRVLQERIRNANIRLLARKRRSGEAPAYTSR
jgi:hypothetical protein